MSPTLLECAVVFVLLVVAWQLGVLLAPIIWREVQLQLRAFDETRSDVDADREVARLPRMKEDGDGS